MLSFVLVVTDSSVGTPFFSSSTELQRKRESKDGFKVNLHDSSENGPPYIPPNEFGRKREVKRGFMVNLLEARDEGPPYIPPNEFGRKREVISDFMEKHVDSQPLYNSPMDFRRTRTAAKILKEKARYLGPNEREEAETQ